MSSRFKLLCTVVLVAALSVLATAGGTGAPAGASSRLARGAKGTTKCPANTPTNSTCVTIPAHCPTPGQCPEIVAEPTSDLAVSQAVYLTMTNFFDPSDSIYVQYCQDTEPLSVKPPMCVKTPVAELTNPQVVLKPFPSSGSVSYAFQVLFLAKGSTPFAGVVPGEAKFGSFLCDAADPCSIDVTDPYLGPHGSGSALTPTTQNTAVIPVTFAAENPGCRRATFINTESEFGIDDLLAAAAAATCTGANPVADNNVDLDAPSAVEAFAQGVVPIALTDSPLSPDEQATLKSMKGQYAFIPVALSANTVAFQAVAQGQQGYPDTSFDLTPAMTAGLITNFYSTSYHSDVVKCPWRSSTSCPLIELLNPVPGFEAPLQYGSYVRGDGSTPTYAVFQWVCNAPVVPITLRHHSVTEQYTVEQILNYAWTLNGLPKLRSCPVTLDTFPGFVKSVSDFGVATTPQSEAEKIAGFVPLPQDSVSDPRAGFSDMSWPDSRQYGLSVAALQNASGKFVLPSAESLEASASAMTPDAQGIYTYNYANEVPDSYPMPDVWYALVKTTAQTPADVQADSALVDDLLAVSGGKQVSVLPTGYAPLPPAMYKAALADLTKDISVSGSTPTTTTTVPTTTMVSAGSGPTGNTTSTGSVAPTPPSTPVTTVASGHAGSTKTHQPPIRIPTQLASFVLTGRSGTWMLALFACLLAAGFLFGPGLLVWGRRRKAGTRGDS